MVAYGLFQEGHGGRGQGVVIGEWERAAKLVLSADVAERSFSALPIARYAWPRWQTHGDCFMWQRELDPSLMLLAGRTCERLLQHVAYISMGWARGVRQNIRGGVREGVFGVPQLHPATPGHQAQAASRLL